MSRYQFAAVGAICVIVFGLSAPTCHAQRIQPVEVGEKAPDFKLQSLRRKTVQLSQTLEDGSVVLVVLRGFPGYQCPICSRQVGGLVNSADAFKAAGARVVMVYPGPSEALADKAREFLGDKRLPAQFDLVIDPDYEFTNAYGLRWNAPRETAYPAVYVVNKAGQVTFAHVSNSHGNRAKTADVLKALK